MDINTFDKAKNRFVRCGHTEGNKFFRQVDPDRHFFRKYWGYAIQRDVLETLPSVGVDTIVLCTKNKQISCPVEKFHTFGIESSSTTHGDQVALNIDFFDGDEVTKKLFCGCPL